MKKVLGILLIIFTFTLSGCETVEITPDVMEVYVQDIVWNEDSLLMDLYITNGTTTDFLVEQLEIWFDLPDERTNENGSTTFAGAVFVINETVQSNGFLQYKISLTKPFIYMDKDILMEFELSLDDLVLQYEFI